MGHKVPPNLPRGTVMRSLTGRDGVTYHLVRLDHPVKCLRAETGRDWVLHNVVIAPHFKGGSLESLRSSPPSTVHIAIANELGPTEPDDPLLDFSKVAYFGLGSVKR